MNKIPRHLIDNLKRATAERKAREERGELVLIPRFPQLDLSKRFLAVPISHWRKDKENRPDENERNH